MRPLPEMITIELTNEQSALAIDQARLHQAARLILIDHGAPESRLSIAVVDDPTIHQLNRQFLQHDYPTDVLSFTLEQNQEVLEGEVVVSAETAMTRSTEFGWSPEEELLLYVIHGVLHLVGFEDKESAQRQKMRDAEARYLDRLGVARHSGEQVHD